MKTIRTKCTDNPHLWIGHFLQTGNLDHFYLESLTVILDLSRLRNGLKQLSTIFDEFERQINIRFDIFLDQI